MLITPINHNSPYFCAYEKTFVMIKPDAIKRNLDNKIMEQIKTSGLDVLKLWSGVSSRSKMENNYIAHKGKSFFSEWIDFMVSGDIKAMVLGGDDAVSKANVLKTSIRSEFAPGERRYNLVHSSDDNAAADREIANFFDFNA